MKLQSPKHILLSRTDNIGDVILTLPLATLLKQHFPHCKITFLARNYVNAVVQSSPVLDEFLSWDTLDKLPEDEAIKALKQLNADTIIHVFPKKKIATLAKKAGISHRIGTSRRWYHYFTCNHRVKFSRSKSILHEAQLNLKLLSAFNLETVYSLPDTANLISLKCKESLPQKIKEFLHPEKFNLVIHPLTNGNTREWPLEYFKTLINSLPQNQFNILITGSPKENQLLQKPLIQQCPHALDITGKLSLNELLQLISASDGLLANSTGPLHMAAALGIHTLGIFPPAVTMNPNRWAPLGKKAQFTVIDKTCDAKSCTDGSNCACIRAITPQQVQTQINHWLN